MANYTVKKGDNLYNIVKSQYGLKSKTEIMNTVKYLQKENNLKNINLIGVGQEIKLPEQLRLQSVMVINPETRTYETLSSNTTNYYRANDIFGDIATKQKEYEGQPFVPSKLNKWTVATENVIENVVANVKAFFTSDTAKDEKMADIFAKQIGIWYKDGQKVSGGFEFEQTEAYEFACKINDDDCTKRETEGKAEKHKYLDRAKTDGKVTLFSLEKINGKEYFTMRGKDNKVHYFDRNNNLCDATKEITN